MVGQRQCLLCLPESAACVADGLHWRPLVPSVPRYPWSLLWLADTPSPHVLTLVAIARELSRHLGWLDSPEDLAS